MNRLFSLVICLICGLTSLTQAEERRYLGHGHALVNDIFGDMHDRWRTGSFAGSWVWGPQWGGHAPGAFGQLLELRFNGEILAPENLNTPAAGDRPYASALSLGLHSHFAARQVDMAIGADLVVTGNQTGLHDFQRFLHDVLGGRQPSAAVLNAQISDDVHPTLVVEAGRDMPWGNAMLRPFVEGRWGVETLIRAGADVTFGTVGDRELLARDPVTGQRYRIVRNPFAGLAFVVGADVAYVDDSEYLPSSAGVSLTDTRNRIRAGVHWQNEKGSSIFYGLTWLDKEFDTQRESQVVGSMRLRLKF